jgi:hypothetical protein
MLAIRPEQMDALGDQSRKQFLQRMADFLRDKFSDRAKKTDNGQIDTFVERGVDKAETYGIEYEDDIRQFLEYLVIYGPDMDVQMETAWIGDILRRADIDGTYKMKLIDETELTLR